MTLLARLFLLLFTDALQIKAASNPLMKMIWSRIATSETCEYKMWHSFYVHYVMRWILTSVFVVVLQNCNKHQAGIYFQAGLSEQPETTISVSALV